MANGSFSYLVFVPWHDVRSIVFPFGFSWFSSSQCRKNRTLINDQNMEKYFIYLFFFLLLKPILSYFNTRGKYFECPGGPTVVEGGPHVGAKPFNYHIYGRSWGRVIMWNCEQPQNTLEELKRNQRVVAFSLEVIPI